jgi:hypothetical protein
MNLIRILSIYMPEAWRPGWGIGIHHLIPGDIVDVQTRHYGVQRLTILDIKPDGERASIMVSINGLLYWIGTSKCRI